VLIGFVVEIARGQDGQPYAALGAIAGIAYVIALIVLRIRR
jgi:nitrate reductase gamma subunit